MSEAQNNTWTDVEGMDTSADVEVSSVGNNSPGVRSRNLVPVNVRSAIRCTRRPSLNPVVLAINNRAAAAGITRGCMVRNEMVRRLHHHHRHVVCRPVSREEFQRRQNETVARIARIQKSQIIEDSLAIEEYFNNCQSILANKLLSYEQMAGLIEKKLDHLNINSWMRCEQRAVQLDMQIKFSLTLGQADVEKCLFLLDELSATAIAPLMLKKHPSVLETVRKTRKYVGNTTQWIDERRRVAFEAKASLIRTKATEIYSKWRIVFGIQDGQSFWLTFLKQVDEFRAATANLHAMQIRNLTEDPTTPSGVKQRVVQDVESATQASSSTSPSNSTNLASGINLLSVSYRTPDFDSAVDTNSTTGVASNTETNPACDDNATPDAIAAPEVSDETVLSAN